MNRDPSGVDDVIPVPRIRLEVVKLFLRKAAMTCTLSVPLQIIAEVHEIDGGGYWAEVRRFPGCVAQGETIEALKANIVQAVEDWLAGSSVKTQDEARQLAEIQGSSPALDESFPQPYGYQPPPSWADEDE